MAGPDEGPYARARRRERFGLAPRWDFPSTPSHPKVGPNKRHGDSSLPLAARRERGTNDNRPPNRKCEIVADVALALMRHRQWAPRRDYSRVTTLDSVKLTEICLAYPPAQSPR